MPQFTQDGVVYEEMPDGKVKVVGYADAPRPATPGSIGGKGMVYAAPPDPYKPKQEARADQDQARQNAADARAAAKDRRDAMEWQATHNPDGSPKPKPGDGLNDADKALFRELQLGNMLQAINDARQIISAGGATGIRGQLGRSFYGSSANDLSGVLTTITGNITLDRLKELKESSKTGASGLGALTEREGRMLANSVASLDDKMGGPTLLKNLARVEDQVRRLQAVEAGMDPQTPEAAKRFEYALPGMKPTTSVSPPDAPASPMDLADPKAKTTFVDDPAARGVNKRVTAMLRAGRKDEVPAYLKSVGINVSPQSIATWDAFLRANPGFKGPVADLERKQVPLSGAGQLMNEFGQSDTGATILGAADALTGGFLDNMTANPAQARAVMSGVADENPYASLLGQAAGMAVPGIGIESGLTRLGAGGLSAAIAGDVLPAMTYGAGSADDGSRVGGAVTGGLAGAIGGALGRGAGRLVQGAADPALQYLSQRGVRMTPGQLIGGIGKRTEDRVAGFPLIGDFIQSQRRRGIEDFNRAAFTEALAPVSPNGVAQIGEAGVGQAQNVIGQAYDNALGGTRVQVDPAFNQDMGSALTAAQGIPRVGTEVRDSLDEIIPSYFDQGPPPSLSGENMQPLLQELRGFRGGYRNDPLGNRVAARVGDAEDAITGMFDRQAPEVMPAFHSANEAYANLAPIQDAVLAAGNSGGVFMPSQLGRQSIAGAKRFQGRNAAARGDRALFDLQRAGQDVLPSQIPDSGTAGRWFVPGALGIGGLGGAGAGAAANSEDRVEGAGSGLGTGVALTSALMSPYLARPLLQRLLTSPRLPAEQALGRFIGQYRLPGALGAPLLMAPGE